MALRGDVRFVAAPRSEMTRVLGQATFSGARQLGARVATRARELCPRGEHREGEAHKGPPLFTTIVHREFVDSTVGWRVLVGSPSPVAFYVHEGTHAHLIKPQTATVLRFTSRSTGQVVFARQVDHPGTRPNPFLRRAMEEIVRAA